MRITGIRGIPVESNLIVRVDTDEGVYGIGEAGMAPQIPATVKVLEYYADWLVGEDPADIERIWQSMFRHTRRKEGIVLISAISGIDMALWDIKGKAAALPVWSLLGGRARDHVELYAHVHGPTIEATVEAAQAAVERGFRAVRFGFDAAGSDAGFDSGKAIRYTAKLAGAIRGAVGDDIDITVDVHQRLSPARAVEFCAAVADYGLLFVEDPIRPEDPAAYRQIRSRITTPIATGENLYSKWQFRSLIEEELTDYLRIDLALAGGISEARKIAAAGETHYLEVVPHCARGPFLEQVSLHFSIATANVALQEHTGGPEWWNDVFDGLADFGAGSATPANRPGFGVSFNEDEARKHPFVQRQMPRWLKPDGSVQDW